jgi:hypothetical protein
VRVKCPAHCVCVISVSKYMNLLSQNIPTIYMLVTEWSAIASIVRLTDVKCYMLKWSMRFDDNSISMIFWSYENCGEIIPCATETCALGTATIQGNDRWRERI